MVTIIGFFASTLMTSRCRSRFHTITKWDAVKRARDGPLISAAQIDFLDMQSDLLLTIEDNIFTWEIGIHDLL